MTPRPSQEDVDLQTADWLARKRSGAMTPAQACELELWLAQDGEHRAAFELAERMWEGVEALRHDPEMLALRERALSRRGTERRRLAGWAAAACVVLAIGAGSWSLVRSGAVRAAFPAPAEQVFHTSVGQRTTVTLTDGSIVTLDTDTVLRTRETRRQRLITLERGQARFQVAWDAARPFVVFAAGKRVTATGTVFDVRAEPARFEVTLLQGHVHVEALNRRKDGLHVAPVAEMSPGSRLATADGAHWTLGPIDTDSQSGWVRGQLIYDSAPLGSVVAEMNRYSDRKLVIAQPALARAPLSGIYKAGDIDGFTAALQAYGVARIGARTNSEVVLVAVKRKENSENSKEGVGGGGEKSRP